MLLGSWARGYKLIKGAILWCKRRKSSCNAGEDPDKNSIRKGWETTNSSQDDNEPPEERWNLGMEADFLAPFVLRVCSGIPKECVKTAV